MTSKPYPAIWDDGIAATGELVRGLVWLPPIEGFTAGASLEDGVLRVGLTDADMGLDAITATASLVGGELLTGSEVEYDVPAEWITATASLEGGSLERGLIVYSNYPPESIAATASLISGSLT